MKLRSGGLRLFPLGEAGSKKIPEVHVVSFASNWRSYLDQKGLSPVAVGMSDSIKIWHEGKTSWDVVYEEKCTRGVKVLAWQVGEDADEVLRLAYADGCQIKLAVYDNEDGSVYKLSTIHNDALSREASCLSWQADLFLAAMLPGAGNSDCFIFSASSKIQHIRTNDTGTIARFIPFLHHLLIGGPNLNHVQIYTRQSESHNRRPTWFFYLSIECQGGISEISVYAPEGVPNRHMVAIVGCNSTVHLYEFKELMWNAYGLTSLDSEKTKQSNILDQLQTITIGRDGVLPISVAWESFKTIAIFCSDGAIRIYMDTSTDKNYLFSDILRWDQHLSHVSDATRLYIDWPQPGEEYEFGCPVLSVTADAGHGFVTFFELVNETQPGTSPHERDLVWESNYYLVTPLASPEPEPEATVSSDTKDEAAEVTLGLSDKVFCNMPLNMDEIKAIGFEMDFALVQHDIKYLNLRECEDARWSLFNDKNYQIHDMLSLKHDKVMIRGLVIDKKRGNFLKMDKNNYVDIAYHGYSVMTSDQKNAAYGAVATKHKFDSTDYVIMDTFYSLSEGCLFANIVDFKDSNPEKINKSYEAIYDDISDVLQTVRWNRAIPALNRDDPHITKNMQIVPMLREFRERGLKTFLLSSRSWAQTDSLMSYICEPDNTCTTPNQTQHWMEYFDVIITSRGMLKEAFFLSDKHQDIFHVTISSGSLENRRHMQPPQVEDASNKMYKVFQGGDVGHLLSRLQVSRPEVLFVTHQINQRVLCSPGWRNLLIIPELTKETDPQYRKSRKEMNDLKRTIDQLENEAYLVRKTIGSQNVNYEDVIGKASDMVHDKWDKEKKLKQLEENLSKLNGPWGTLMKAGYKNSLFAKEVENNAYLYTTTTTNLVRYPPTKYFDLWDDVMKHDSD